jgi:hypothetical protein
MRGRKPVGPSAAAQVPGSAQARERAEVILQTLAGTCRMEEACRRLGVGKTRFHQLRQELLQAAVASQEPRPIGRPPRPEASASAEEVATLERRVVDLEVAARTAQIQEEIALILPRVGRAEPEPAAAAEKKTRRRPRTRRRSRRST